MADARLVLRDGRVVENTLTIGSGDSRRQRRSLVLSASRHEVRPAMAARETRASWRRLLFFFICIAVGVAAIVALRSVIQSVREVLRRRGAVAHRRRRAHLDQPRLDRRRRARRSTAALAEAGAHGAHRNDRDADDGAAGGSSRSRWRRWSSCARVQPEFPLYGTVVLERGTALLARAAAEPRRARAARAADGARRQGRRPDRRSARRRSRSAASLTNEPGRRIGGFSLGPARAHRLRRPAVDRPARLRQPRAPACCCVRVPEDRHRRRWSRALRARLRGRVRQRALVPLDRRSRSAATSIAPRTT